MTITKLLRRALIPDTEVFQTLFTQPELALSQNSLLGDIQARLFYALKQFLHPQAISPFLLVKAPEELDYFNLLNDVTVLLREPLETLTGVNYQITGKNITMQPAQQAGDNFASQGPVIHANWVEPEQLFGCVRQFNGEISLQPGLVHQANGGVLILSLRALLTQPLLWMRLKNIVTQQRFCWLSFDNAHPLPVSIPTMPLSLKIMLLGERELLADFQAMEPELYETIIYSEYEDNLQIVDEGKQKLWCQWVWYIVRQQNLPGLDPSIWPLLIQEAVRYTGDQRTLPLCPLWISRQLRETSAFSELGNSLNAKQLTMMLNRRQWREGYLRERMQDEILLEQILIETDGERIGQINALSVLEFPGHPRTFGEPSRISCAVHIGDGEFTDIERKAELGGNIHAKGIMIMQSFLMAELGLQQQIPFSASLTFEQSYGAVDGDSASMAELCALISALAKVPLKQSIAITGSVDQFGRAQPVGGLNEKIEGFFVICQQRGLTGKQGVIIPSANIRHLSLALDVQQAVEANEFALWAIDNVTDALPLLTQLAWDGEGKPTLLQIIKARIAQATQQDLHQRSWPLGWLNWFHVN